jgi:putative acetyltransferase
MSGPDEQKGESQRAGFSGDEYPLRPFVAADTMALRELFAQSIEELTQEEYTEEQRLAWVGQAVDSDAFADKLGKQLTLIVQVAGDYLGFATLKDNTMIDMLYVHPHHAGLGVGTALIDALEKIATARGTAELTVEVSDTAVPFFESRGYVASSRNLLAIDDEWLSNTTMKKALGSRSAKIQT